MNTKTLDQITNHLEFLGYRIEKKEPDQKDGKPVFFAIHSTRNNLMYLEGMTNFIFFQVGLNCEKAQSSEMFTYINTFNSIANIVRAYCLPQEEGQSLLRFEANYIGEYSKEIFGQFYDLLETDQQRFNSFENFQKIFLK